MPWWLFRLSVWSLAIQRWPVSQNGRCNTYPCWRCAQRTSGHRLTLPTRPRDVVASNVVKYVRAESVCNMDRFRHIKLLIAQSLLGQTFEEQQIDIDDIEQCKPNEVYMRHQYCDLRTSFLTRNATKQMDPPPSGSARHYWKSLAFLFNSLLM